jgi:hypothetical protein
MRSGGSPIAITLPYFPPDCPVSERIIVSRQREREPRNRRRPLRPLSSDDDGAVTYYATCTAFNGFEVLPQMITTPDFRSFRISTLNGKYAANKGMAFFPRKLAGSYAAISRFDGENLYLLRVRQRRLLEHGEEDPWTAVSLGVLPDRQLRLPDRNRRWLALAQSRRRSDASLHDRRGPVGQGRIRRV